MLPAFKKGKQWLILENDLKSFENSDWFINRKAGPKTIYAVDEPRHKRIVAHNRRRRENREQKRLEQEQKQLQDVQTPISESSMNLK